MRDYFENTLNRTSTFLLFVLLSVSLQGQDVHCKWFKEGKFKYTEAEHGDWDIERLGAYQFEYSEKYDVLFVASLEWVDECSYLLQYVSISNSKYFDAYGKLLYCEVIPIDADSYKVVVDDEGEIISYLMNKVPDDNTSSVGSR